MPQYILNQPQGHRVIEITHHANGWRWREVDENGRYISGDSQPFESEEKAKAHAKAILGGGHWSI